MLRSPLVTGSRRTPCRCESAVAERCFAHCSTRIRATGGATRVSGARVAALAGCRCAATSEAVLFRCVRVLARVGVVRPPKSVLRPAGWRSCPARGDPEPGGGVVERVLQPGSGGGGLHALWSLDPRSTPSRGPSPRSARRVPGLRRAGLVVGARARASRNPRHAPSAPSTRASGRCQSETSPMATRRRRSSGSRPCGEAPHSRSCSRGTPCACSRRTDLVDRCCPFSVVATLRCSGRVVSSLSPGTGC